MRKRLISIFLLIAMTAALLFGDSYGVLKKGLSEEEELYKDAMVIWYTDPQYGEYIRDAAVTYENKTGVKVIATEVSDVDYLESVQRSTLDGVKTPDLFVLTNDSLEKAVLSGLAGECKDPEHVLNSAYYADAGLRAVTYRDVYYGYPLSYETAVIVYNESALEEIVRTKDALAESGETTEGFTIAPEILEQIKQEEMQEDLSYEEQLELEARAKAILPTSVVGILDFANQYSLPEGMESYFNWDTKDVLYNYWFAGAYLNVGGECCDKSEDINIYNEQALYSLKVFQDFKNFFSMDDEKGSYADTIEAFIERKSLFTVAGTDVISKLEKAKADDLFHDEYDILPIGMLNSSLNCRGLSVTTMVCVNGLSENKGAAESFAAFMTTEYAPNLYARCSKMTAAHLKEYPYPQMETIESCYEKTVSLPKMVETGNYYILAEMCFSNIWDGEDVNKELKQLSETVLRNYYGKDFENVPIETPEVTESYNQVGEN